METKSNCIIKSSRMLLSPQLGLSRGRHSAWLWVDTARKRSWCQGLDIKEFMILSVAGIKNSGLNAGFPAQYLLLSMGWSLSFWREPVLCSLKICWSTHGMEVFVYCSFTLAVDRINFIALNTLVWKGCPSCFLQTLPDIILWVSYQRSSLSLWDQSGLCWNGSHLLAPTWTIHLTFYHF